MSDDELMEEQQILLANRERMVSIQDRLNEIIGNQEKILANQERIKELSRTNASLREQIIERQKAEEALRQARDELEMRVRERTAELAQANEVLQAEIAERRRVERARTELLRRLVTAQEDERRHIARELHDQIGQILTGLNLALEMSLRLPPEEIRHKLREAQNMVNDLIMQVRNLSLDLRPAMLDDIGLLPALLWHFERYTAQTGVRVTFEHRNLERRFGTEVETAAYRIVQEALTNVARHAGVAHATVHAWASNDTLCLQVEDEGCGFDPVAAQNARASSGLAGMYERALALGGQLRIESALGAYTRLLAELPLNGAGGKNPA
jgi:signal transduction histidine kinase